MRWNTDHAYWEEWYPADFITESFPGQFRNWFYALLALSTMMSDGEPPFKVLLGHGLVRDQFGEEMHKTTGNSIEFIAAADQGFTLLHKLKPNEKPETPDGALGFAEVEVMDKTTGKPVKAMRVAWPAIGADTMRWLYCRQNPAQNLNFGPIPAREVRAKFLIKLWNCYAFFCNYARLDGFDPAAVQVPVGERPDIDRWILSDLQGLIRTARDAFEKYDVMRFCHEAERFVDDRLSNWYVRRNRDRFWSKNAELDDAGRRDKLAAYQTLYTVLCDLCKLCAPVIPFLTEVMWQNLRTENDAQSVHLCDYPAMNESLLDAELSRDMDLFLRVVTVGGALRNEAKHKVRQPLAAVAVAAGSDIEQQAVERFANQLCDELNIKNVVFLDPNDREFLKIEWKFRKKVAAPKYGSNFKRAEAALTALSDSQKANFGHEGGRVPLGDGLPDAEPSDVEFAASVPEGWIAKRGDKGTIVVIDTRITPELKAEGMARDVIRLVQDERKKAGLDVADRIVLFLGAESDALRNAIAAHRDTIAAETQVAEWADTAPAGAVHTATVKVDGQPLTISLRKV
jgi:isoleucyl-tRNA synthetase